MTTRSILVTALAVVCVVSIGVSATTLESAVQTDPDDVIDLDWERIPIGEDAAIAVKAEMAENGELHETETPGTEGREEVDHRQQPGGENQADGRTERLRERALSSAQEAASSPDPFPWGLLRLISAIATLAGVAALGYQYTRRRGDGNAGSTGSSTAAPPWPPAGPTTEVDRAWFAMVRRLDVDRPWTRTPTEFAAAAVEAGMDPDAVERVTSAFEDVHYGGAPVTSTHRERARAGLGELDIDPEGGLA